MAENEHITELLAQARQGDSDAEQRVYGMVYPELKRIAWMQLRARGAAADLTPTALVNEAFIKLDGARDLPVVDRRHFYRLLSKAMREVLLDVWRQAAAAKRGGNEAEATFTESHPGAEQHLNELLDLDAALNDLAQIDARLREVFELHHFAGLGFEEIAECLGMSSRTAHRDWASARAFLMTRMDLMTDAASIRPGADPIDAD